MYGPFTAPAVVAELDKLTVDQQNTVHDQYKSLLESEAWKRNPVDPAWHVADALAMINDPLAPVWDVLTDAIADQWELPSIIAGLDDPTT